MYRGLLIRIAIIAWVVVLVGAAFHFRDGVCIIRSTSLDERMRRMDYASEEIENKVNESVGPPKTQFEQNIRMETFLNLRDKLTKATTQEYERQKQRCQRIHTIIIFIAVLGLGIFIVWLPLPWKRILGIPPKPN
jgi:hypothetical protein